MFLDRKAHLLLRPIPSICFDHPNLTLVHSRLQVTSIAFLSIAIASFSSCSRHPTASFGADLQLGHHLSGTVKTISHVFQINNSTNHTITIKGIEKSCSCANIELDQSPIHPGERRSLRLFADLTPSYTKRRVMVAIKTDYAPQPRWEYAISYYCHAPLEFSDNCILLGEERHANHNLATKVDLLAYLPVGSKELPRCDISSSPGLSVAPIGPPVIEEIVNPQLDLGPTATDRVQRQTLEIRIANEKQTSEAGYHGATLSATLKRFSASLSVTYLNPRGLQASPSKLHFGVVTAADLPVSRQFLVSHTSGLPFEIATARSDFEGMDVQIVDTSPSLSKRIDKRHLLKCTLKWLPTTAQFASGTLTVITKPKENPKCTLSWSAFLLGTPTIKARTDI